MGEIVVDRLAVTIGAEYDRDKEIEGISDVIIAELIEQIETAKLLEQENKESHPGFMFAEYAISTTNFSELYEVDPAIAKAYVFFEDANYKVEKIEYLKYNKDNKPKTEKRKGLRVSLR